MREGMAGNLDGVPKRQDQENDAIPKIAPKWLKYDRHVGAILRLEAHCPALLFYDPPFCWKIFNFYISEFKFIL